MIWLALILPIGTIIALRILWSREMAWWEYFVPPIAVVLAIGLGKFIAYKALTHDTEYWGGWAVQASYYEPWDEKVSCSHAKYRTETYECGDSKSPRTCTREVFDGWQHPYDVRNHPPQWYLYDTLDNAHGISKSKYQEFVSRWGGPVYRDMHRHYHSQDGDAYDTVFDGARAALEPVTELHTYENKVAASNSIFNYPEIDPAKSPVFEYPDLKNWRCKSVLSKETWPNSVEIEKLNGVLGASKQVRIWVLIWQNQPRQVALDQEAYWKGGNKNELVICLSQSKGQIQWCRIFSWTRSENLKVGIESYLAVDNRQLDFATFTPWLEKEIKDKWVRRQFKEFDYLSVEPSGWGAFFIWLFAAIVCVVSSAICLRNDVHDDLDPSGRIREFWQKIQYKMEGSDDMGGV